jgi:hypothetical protein
LATCSAEKLDGFGGSIGAIEGRHAKSNNPANMKQAVTRIAIEMRRIIVFFLQWVTQFLLELDSIHSPIRLSPQLTNCVPDRVRRISILNL